MTSNHKPHVGLNELKRFIETAKLDASAIAVANSATRGVYKKFYALLLFDLLLQSSLKEVDQKTYAREAISDMSHGFFLTCIGLYKPARTSIRSAIENLIRFLFLYKGGDAINIKSVYSLFEEARAVFSANKKQKKRVEQLHALYGELCKTVHSSSADYMNLELPFNTMLTFDESKYSINRDIVRDCCKVAGELLFVEFDDQVQKAHYSHKDILSDSVAKSVRREARELREAV